MSVPLEHDYIGLSEASLMERSSDKISSSDVLNLKETELRLGLPGSGPEGKNLATRRKRGFSGKWDLSINCKSEANWGKEDILFSPRKGNEGSKQVELKKSIPLKENGAPHSSKAQVVGWPPIRSFRKSTLATTSSKKNDIEAKGGSSCLYVKVSMDGAPYLRKVDIKSYNNYGELSSALENMFSCFSIGQCASDRHSGEDEVSGGSEYVLTYEDKDGDWMLVGDVPWEMFSDSCKRMRIMKSSEAIGLAPRAINKCKNQN